MPYTGPNLIQISLHAMQRQVDEQVPVGEQEFVGCGSGHASQRLSQTLDAIALACALAGVRASSSFECVTGHRWVGNSGAQLLLEYICEK